MEPDDMITLPSGQTVRFHEFVHGAPGDGLTYRFRFIAPQLAETMVDPVQSEGDMVFLCENIAIPRVADMGMQADHIVISIADQETEFGVAAPGVTQVFESYSLDGDACIWEPF